MFLVIFIFSFPALIFVKRWWQNHWSTLFWFCWQLHPVYLKYLFIKAELQSENVNYFSSVWLLCMLEPDTAVWPFKYCLVNGCSGFYLLCLCIFSQAAIEKEILNLTRFTGTKRLWALKEHLEYWNTSPAKWPLNISLADCVLPRIH